MGTTKKAKFRLHPSNIKGIQVQVDATVSELYLAELGRTVDEYFSWSDWSRRRAMISDWSYWQRKYIPHPRNYGKYRGVFKGVLEYKLPSGHK